MTKHDYFYFGTCIDTVDELELWDATQMSNLIENSKKYDIRKMYPFIEDKRLLNRIKKDKEGFECGISDNKRIIWIWDLDKDIHYFFVRGDVQNIRRWLY